MSTVFEPILAVLSHSCLAITQNDCETGSKTVASMDLFQMAPYTPSTTTIDSEKEESASVESLAGQYMRTIQSVSSELYLDGLRQEVSAQAALLVGFLET